jgi:hypothetical protein
MRTLFIASFFLCASVCWGRGGATALEVHGASPGTWLTVKAVVHAYARQHGFQLGRKSANDLVYDLDPDHRTTLFVARSSDTVTLEMVEAAENPSRRHRTLERELKVRLESAGLRVSPTQSSIVITN